MDIKTDFSYVDFTPDGDLLALRSIATPKEAKVAYESPGAPAREGCGLTEQTLEILREAPMEIVMNDDTVNLVFFSAWRGGFLDFDVPAPLRGFFTRSFQKNCFFNYLMGPGDLGLLKSNSNKSKMK